VKGKIYLSIVSQRKKKRESVNDTGFEKERVGKHVVVGGDADWQGRAGR
jgi:hypothetical protein